MTPADLIAVAASLPPMTARVLSRRERRGGGRCASKSA